MKHTPQLQSQMPTDPRKNTLNVGNSPQKPAQKKCCGGSSNAADDDNEKK